MKFTNIALTAAALGAANAGPVSKRAISDGLYYHGSKWATTNTS